MFTWIGAVVSFVISALYIVPREASINTPGELEEVFSSAGILVFVALILLSVILVVANHKKEQNAK